MDFETILKNRRSIRDFQNREMPLSILEEILRETCLAPTASNGQPCRFIIVRERDTLQRLSDESKKNLLSDLEKNPNSPLKIYESYLRDPQANLFYNAPCLVLFVGPRALHSLEVDSALTVAYFMFSATARGLGTCWIGLGAHIRDREMLADIGLPADCRIVAPIVVGYPAAIPAASERHSPDILKVI